MTVCPGQLRLKPLRFPRKPCPLFSGMVRRYRGEVADEVANVAPDDLARIGRRLAAHARTRGSEENYGVIP
eukprot:11851699-Alexandrium_andersonii.AAC.1